MVPRPETGQLAASQLRVGDRVATRKAVVDLPAFHAFAALTGDAHPIHYDAAYAQAQGLEAPIAHGLLLASLTALGATALSARLHDSMVAMIDVHAEFLIPVFAGDEIEMEFTVDAVEPRSRNRSLVSFVVEMSRASETCVRVRQRYLMKTELDGDTP